MKRLLLFALIAALFLPAVGQDNEYRVHLGDLIKAKAPSYAFNLNQNLRTTDSPTFAGLTLTGTTFTINGSSGILDNGTVPLTADWNVGAFDLTAVDMTATNFKLSGTGTLTSTTGNAMFTTALTAASGDEVGFYLPVTVNKAAGNYTALKVNVTETSAPGTADLLVDFQVGSVSKSRIDNAGSYNISNGAVSVRAAGYYSYIAGACIYSNGGTGGYHEFRIGTTPTFTIKSTGVASITPITSTMINNADSDTDEVDSVVFAGGYGLVIAASITDGTSAVWKLKGTTFEAIEVDADWTATKDGAATYNVYFEGGAIKIQNKVGDNKAVKLGFFGI